MSSTGQAVSSTPSSGSNLENRLGSGRSDVRDVGNEVQDVDDRVQGVDDNVGVDDKLDQANRLLSFNPDRYSTGSDSFTGKQLRRGLLQ